MNEKFPEARIALCKCREGNKVFGIRMERTSYGWDRTWAYPIKNFDEKKEEQTEKVMEGLIGTKEGYPGCPFCKTFGMVVCGECGRLNCNNGRETKFTCNWCGFTGELVGPENETEGNGRSGFSFKSGNDR